jgi:hypothetical protein
MNITEAINDPHLFKRWFEDPSWDAWRAFLAALFGLPLTDTQLTTYQQCTGRTTAPTAPYNEAWLRRSCALLSAIAQWRHWPSFIARGRKKSVRLAKFCQAKRRQTMFRRREVG